jgi:hypothetical protein
MARKLAAGRVTLISRLSVITLNVIALAFLIAAVCLTGYFYTDGFGGFADGLPLAAVSSNELSD